jgi:predicted RNase H-like nuclease (RuvC/YqgF family)
MKLNVMKLFRDLMKLGKVETEQGVLIYEGEVLEEGTEVFIEDENGNIVPAPDGQYGEYKVVDGKIAPAEVVEPEAEPESEEVKQEEEVVEPEPEVETPDYEKRFEALEAEIADLKAAIAELQKEKEDMEFSQLKPAEKEIKDIVTKESKGAMKYFEK